MNRAPTEPYCTPKVYSVPADTHYSMAIGDVALNPGRIAVQHMQGPGRPLGARELMPVPGNPQALPHRPAVAPGRIPVGGEISSGGQDAAAILHQAEAAKEGSSDYQIIKRVLMARAPDGSRHAPENSDASPKPVTDAQPPAVPESAPTPPPSSDAAAPAPTAPAVQTVEVQVTSTHVVAGVVVYERVEVKLQAPPPPVQKSDPLVLDLNGDGVKTTGVAQGAKLDINADGRVDQSSVATGGDAFLVYDRNGNGRIDNGTELFGDQRGAANGFEALRLEDDNKDGRIDGRDLIYNRLQMLTYTPDGQQHLTSLSEAGVSAINLGYQQVQAELGNGDSVAQTGSFERTDGSTGVAADLMLSFRTVV